MNKLFYTLVIICICCFYSPVFAQFQQASPITLTGGTPEKINALKNSPLIKEFAVEEEHNVVTFVPVDGVSMQEFLTFWNTTLDIRESPPKISNPIMNKTHAPMNGTYTIDGGTATTYPGGTNFQTFTAAATALSTDGVASPVIINVLAGTYNEKVIINAIPGISATNTVTIDGGVGNAATRILTNSVATTNARYTLLIQNVSYFRLKNITVRATGATWGWGIHMKNVPYCHIKNCIVEITGTGATNTTENYAGLVANGVDTSCFYNKTGTPLSYLEVDSNTFNAGWRNITIVGSGGSTQVKVRKNIMNNAHHGCCIVENINGSQLTDNIIVMRGTDMGARGLALYNSNSSGANIHQMNNNSCINSGWNAFYFATSTGGAGALRGQTWNNMGSCVKGNGNHGIYTSSNYYDIWHNNMNLTTPGNNCNGIQLYFVGNNNNLRNNIFAISAAGFTNSYPVFVSSRLLCNGLNYNDYYSLSSANLLRIDSVWTSTQYYYTAANFNTAAYPYGSGFNSLNVDPMFTGPCDLHISQLALVDAGANLGVPDDYDRQPRSCMPPDIGADEIGGALITNWNGSVSTDWFNAANWDNGIPVCCKSAVIPTGMPLYPEINALASTFHITIQSAASVTLLVSNTLDVCGNWTQTGTFTPNTGTVRFVGTSPQNYMRNTGAVGDFYNVVINNTSGTGVTLVNGSTTSDMNIAVNLTFLNGRIITGPAGGNKVDVRDSSSTAIVGHNLARYVQGNLQRAIRTAVGQSYDFPVGDAPLPAKGYQLINYNFTTATDYTNLLVYFSPVMVGTWPTTSECGNNGYDAWCGNGQWNVAPTPVAPAIMGTYHVNAYPLNFTAAYAALNYTPVTGNASATVSRKPTAGSWGLYGTCDVTSTLSGATPRVGRLGITAGFSDFAITLDVTNPFPLELLSFTGNNKLSINTLDWKIAQENNLKGFSIERSFDGNRFDKISFVSSTGNGLYSYQDNIRSIPSLKYYYRLRSENNDGSFSLSNVVEINLLNNGKESITLFPNPSTGIVNLTFNSETKSNTTISVLDITGKQVYSNKMNLKEGVNQHPLNLSHLKNGTYFVVIQSDNSIIYGEFLKIE